MKKKLVYLMLGLVPLCFVSCTLTEDLNNVIDAASELKIVFGTPKFSNTIHVDIRDASTNINLTQAVKVKVSGNDADKIYDNLGFRKSDNVFTSVDGVLDLVIDPRLDSIALEKNPINIILTPYVDGYVGQTQSVVVSNEKFKIVTMKLVNVSSGAISGVSTSKEELNVSYSGDNTSNNTVQNVDGNDATIGVLAGTTLKNEFGQTLKGNIVSQVVYYNPIDPVAQSIISQNLVGKVKQENGVMEQARLVSAGMFNAKLTVGDQTVKTLENNSEVGGLKFRNAVPQGLINPMTGVSVKKGDIISMWSQEDGSGEWVFEKKTEVKEDAGGLYLEDLANHLSNWNWAWSYSNYCSTGLRLNWKLVGINSTHVELNAEFSDPQYRAAWNQTIREYINSNGSYTQMNNVPKNASGRINFSNPNPNAGVTLTFSPAYIDFTDLCSMAAQTITVTAQYNNSYNVHMTLSAKVDDPSVPMEIKPNAYIYYKESSSQNYIMSYMSNGLVNMVIEVGKIYDIKATLGDNTGYGTLALKDIGNNKLQFEFTPMTIGGEVGGDTVILDPVDRPAVGGSVYISYTANITSDMLNKVQSVGFVIKE